MLLHSTLQKSKDFFKELVLIGLLKTSCELEWTFEPTYFLFLVHTNLVSNVTSYVVIIGKS